MYLRRAGHGGIAAIARQGADAPGGGQFRTAFGAVVNDEDEVLFGSDLGANPETVSAVGVFLSSEGALRSVARPGDLLPGGGKVRYINHGNWDLNNAGEVVFRARHAEDNSIGSVSGLYVWRGGTIRLGTIRLDTIRLVLRNEGPSGAATLIPGVGKIAGVIQARINDRGQVVTWAGLDDGTDVLLLGTPLEEDD